MDAAINIRLRNHQRCQIGAWITIEKFASGVSFSRMFRLPLTRKRYFPGGSFGKIIDLSFSKNRTGYFFHHKRSHVVFQDQYPEEKLKCRWSLPWVVARPETRMDGSQEYRIEHRSKYFRSGPGKLNLDPDLILRDLLQHHEKVFFRSPDSGYLFHLYEQSRCSRFYQNELKSVRHRSIHCW